MIPILFCESNSVYKTIPGADVFDAERNALTWKGNSPGVFHPPCRLWSRLRSFSTADLSEKFLGLWAIEMVNTYGGVLEHPSGSSLFKYVDKKHLISVDQSWFGHPCRKRTYLYIRGISRSDIPPYPCLGFVSSNVQDNKAWRNRTPLAFAQWLMEIASRSGRP